MFLIRIFMHPKREKRNHCKPHFETKRFGNYEKKKTEMRWEMLTYDGLSTNKMLLACSLACSEKSEVDNGIDNNLIIFKSHHISANILEQTACHRWRGGLCLEVSSKMIYSTGMSHVNAGCIFNFKHDF